VKIFSLLETQYQSFLSSTKSYLSKTLTNFGSSYGNNTVFGQLINVLAETVQNIMLYIEDALTEQNKYTAQRKKSIWNLAQLTGYKPSFGKAASAQIELTYIPTNSSNTDLIINNHEKLTCTQNGLPYNIILPQEAVVMSIEKDNTTKRMSIVEGRFETQSFVAKGGKLYTYGFSFQGNLDIDYLEVTVNGTKWTRQESLYDMSADGLEYTYRPGIDGKMNLIFGNDMHGRALQAGDEVSFTYLSHDGELGNINVNEGIDFSFTNPISTVSGDTVCGDDVFAVRLASKDSVSSGTDSETTEEMRQMIGLNSRSLVLASPSNYRNFLNKFSFVGYNRTWSETGSLTVNSLVIKNYKNQLSDGKSYFNLTEDSFKLSDTQKTSILNCIDSTGSQLAGVSYNIFDPELCKYAATIYIKLKSSSYDTVYIENQIRNLVGKFFANIENDMFIPKSDIINLIKSNIDEIDSVDVYFISERNEDALKNSKYTKTTVTFNPSTGMYDKKVEEIALYSGENPNLGFDSHGNIQIESDEQFPVLMGGWSYATDTNDDGVLNSNDSLTYVTDPLTIVFE
jgi:hypothetical protein